MRQFHPIADIFPLIEGEEFDQLVASIKASDGPRESVIVYEDMILDGRNRARACEVLGIEPNCFPYRGSDPVAFVIDKNLRRRHLNESQRAMVAAKLVTLDEGRPSKTAPIGAVSQTKAAELLNVGRRTVQRAAEVQDKGIAELQHAVERGEVAVSAAEKIARLPQDQQAAALPKGARAIMSSRQEPDDSLGFFPTPPYATRALIERVFPVLGMRDLHKQLVWEPACGEGHMAEVLREYFGKVLASDIKDYGYEGSLVDDFLKPGGSDRSTQWIVTNPPFGDNAIKFVKIALDLAEIGVAMFFRSQWVVEGVQRYEAIFRDRPPTVCAFFVERVPLCKGRWDPDGSTATAYCWLVWLKNRASRAPFWIPPCRKELTCPDDEERFTKHPVVKKQHLPPHDLETGEIIELAAAPLTATAKCKDGSLDLPDFLRRDPANAWASQQ